MKCCGNCKYFKVLKNNNNFGKCMKNISSKELFDNSVSYLIGGAPVTDVPIIHAENTYSCFEEK